MTEATGHPRAARSAYAAAEAADAITAAVATTTAVATLGEQNIAIYTFCDSVVLFIM